MNNCDKWMGNFILEDGLPEYRNMTFISETIIKVSNQNVQQIRSHYLNKVQKEDVWDTKN